MLGWRLAAALCLAPMMLGCGGGDVFFEISVRNFEPGDGCPFPASYDNWVLMVSQGGVDQCTRGPCLRGDSQPFECVAGFETPPVNADEPLTVTLGLYGAAQQPVACAQRMQGGGVREGSRIVLEMACDSVALMRCPPRMPPTECPVQQPMP